MVVVACYEGYYGNDGCMAVAGVTVQHSMVLHSLLHHDLMLIGLEWHLTVESVYLGTDLVYGTK